MKKIRQCFGAVPAVISVAAGVMLVCLLLVVMAGENALSSAYKGQSFVSSLILGIAGAGMGLLLIRRSNRAKPAKERPVWQLAALFGLVLMVQLGITLPELRAELASRHIIDHKVKQEKMTK